MYRNSSDNGTEDINTSDKYGRYIIGAFLILVTLFTIFGNILVLVAIKREKQLQTKFNTYIINLAVTDLTVALTAMSFYTTENILGYWPFGKFLCGVWIFNDYGMTFASVFTIIVISVDRFWAVTWPSHFKNHHTKKKCLVFIAGVWLFMIVLWLPACTLDRIRANINDDTTICIWDPALNKKFVVVIATVGHHGSFCIILFCYLRVFYILRKKAKFVRKIRPGNLTVHNLSTIEPTTCDIRSFLPDRIKEEPASTESKGNELKPEVQEKYSHHISSVSNGSIMPSTSTSNIMMSRLSTITSTNAEKDKPVTKRDRRAFVTLSYIIIGYVICWVPFHVVFDISAASPELVPPIVFQITFWMTYLNSTINPFLYNFSNPEFRRAFKKILYKLY